MTNLLAAPETTHSMAMMTMTMMTMCGPMVSTVTQLLVVLELCSHVSWMLLKDKSSLRVGLRTEVQGKTRYLDAAVS